MEQIEVSVKYTRDGKMTPLQFKIGDQSTSIQDTGRRWETEEGQHLLVMDYNQRTYHLFQRREDRLWFLIRDILPPQRFEEKI